MNIRIGRIVVVLAGAAALASGCASNPPPAQGSSVAPAGDVPSTTGAGPARLPLLQQTDLAYVGAFRLPAGFEFRATPMAFTSGGTLKISNESWVGELAVPTPSPETTIAALPVATFLSPMKDVLQGRTNGVNPQSPNAKYIGGILPLADGSLVVSAYDGYDGGGTQAVSHFAVAANGSVTGPVRVGSDLAGFVAGYMTAIPAEWQSLFGGPAFTGQCCIPIVSRTSLGPSATVFNPADVATGKSVRGADVLGYPIEAPTLGGCESTAQLFNCTTIMGGLVFPSGSRSVWYFGRTGEGPQCYGNGTANASLHGTMGPDGAMWCHDPVPAGKGPHAYPYVSRVWAYDANDLVAVKNGRRRKWQIRPYASWPLTTRFQDVEGYRQIGGVAYDPARQWIFLSIYKADGASPLIEVWKINVPAS